MYILARPAYAIASRDSIGLPCITAFSCLEADLSRPSYNKQMPSTKDLLHCRALQMSSKYSVTKGNEYVTMLKSIASWAHVERTLFAPPSFFLFRAVALHARNLVVRSKLFRFTAQLLLAASAGICNAKKKKKNSSMPLAVLQDCVPSSLTDKLNGRGRAIDGVSFLKVHRHHAQQHGKASGQEPAGTLFLYTYSFLRVRKR